MYQVEAARSVGVRFYLPCDLVTVFVYACLRDGRRHRDTTPLITTPRGALTFAAPVLTSMRPGYDALYDGWALATEYGMVW